jgi:hypothetical protein
MARIRSLTQETDLNIIDGDFTWTSYSPTITIYSGAGSISAYSTAFAHYIQIGDLVFAQGEMRITISSPSTTTVLGITLPVNVNWSGFSANQHIGIGGFTHASNSYFPTRLNLVNGEQVANWGPANRGVDSFTSSSLRWHRFTMRYKVR